MWLIYSMKFDNRHCDLLLKTILLYIMMKWLILLQKNMILMCLLLVLVVFYKGNKSQEKRYFMIIKDLIVAPVNCKGAIRVFTARLVCSSYRLELWTANVHWWNGCKWAYNRSKIWIVSKRNSCMVIYQCKAVRC